MPASAVATVWVPLSPTPADLNNLDHFEFYSWRIDFASNRTAASEQTDSATPTFKRLYNWDLDANMLFLHLANTATYGGVRTLTDDNAEPTGTADELTESPGSPDAYPEFGPNNILITTRSFARSSTGPNAGRGSLVEPPGWSVVADREGDAAAPLRSAVHHVFTYTYTFTETKIGFTETQIDELQEPILEGDNVALLVDPDLSFFNDKVTLKIKSRRRLRRVPEPAGLLLLGLGVVAGARHLQRKRAKKEDRPELA
jgi:hypothetical protein